MVDKPCAGDLREHAYNNHDNNKNGLTGFGGFNDFPGRGRIFEGNESLRVISDSSLSGETSIIDLIEETFC